MWLTKDQSFLFQKRGIYYFSRRVPADLKEHYKADRIVLSLRTKSDRVAASRANALVTELESDWLTLRWQCNRNSLKRYLSTEVRRASVSLAAAPLLSEAKDGYVTAKQGGRSKTFSQAADRSVRYLIEACGEKPINAYSRADVNALREHLFERGLNQASVRRTFNAVRAIVNFAAREHGLDEVKAFSGVYLGELEESQEKRRNPIPSDVIKDVQAKCMELDDEARWAIALISDTGLRLSEACGLLASDVILDSGKPHILLRPHAWRRLKTRSSERTVPLVGAALWAAQRAVECADGPFLFPRYCSDAGCKANSASGALNKWLAPRVPKGCVVHSFRHSLRDRLRAVQCPKDITDRLGGWTVDGVGEGYGDGYPLGVLSEWMERLAL